MKKIMLMMALGCCFTAPAAYADTDDSGFQTGQDEGLFDTNQCTAKNATSCTGEDPATDIISAPPKPYNNSKDTVKNTKRHHVHHRIGTIVLKEKPAADF